MTNLLIKVLRNPGAMKRLELRQWDQLLRMAKATGVLSSLAVQAQEMGIVDQVC